MKIGIVKTTAGTVSCLLALAVLPVRAVTLNVGLADSLALGNVINGIQAGGQAARDVTMVNNLLTVPLGTSSSSVVGDVGDIYYRSANVFSPLPAATATGSQIASGIADGSALLSITLSSSFVYLVAAYDGPNGGVQVWDIAGIASGSTIEIPRYAEPSGLSSPGHPATGPLVTSTKYLMTGYTLLNPAGGSVPDGGLTIALLGAALMGVGLLRRKLSLR